MALTAAEKIDKIQAILVDWLSWTEIPLGLLGLVHDHYKGMFDSGIAGKILVGGALVIAFFVFLAAWAILHERHQSPWKATIWLVPFVAWGGLKIFGRYSLFCLTLGAVCMAGGIASGRRR